MSTSFSIETARSRDDDRRPRERRSRVAAVAAGLLLAVMPGLGGCLSAAAPQTRIGELTVVERTDEAVRVDVEVILRNPGNEPLTLRRAEYRVSAGGSTWTGQWSAQASIPRLGERTLLLPAVLPADAVDGAERWRVSGRVSWLEPGRIAQVFHEAGLRRPTARFSGAGEMPADRGDAVAGPSPTGPSRSNVDD